MFKHLKKFITGERGSSPWVAVFSMTVLLAFTAMAVDLGMAYMQASKLQAALDAGALAGAAYLPNTTEATAAAIECVELNGYTASDISISFSDSDSKISLTSAKEIDTMFLKALGINQWNIAKKAAAAKTNSGGGGGVFGYRIFYGSNNGALSMGGQFTINGSVHGNNNVSIDPGQGVITGMVEAVKNLHINEWTTTVGGTVCPAQFIEMPDFTEVVDNIMPDSYDEYAVAKTYNEPWWRQTWTGSKYITGNVSVSNGVDIYGDVYIDGNLSVSGGGPFIIHGNLYVDGNINFGNNVDISGSVMATKNITFSGGQNQVDSSTSLCIYSKTGNINITMSSMTATGIIYAPNGVINLAGNNLTFYGSIIGDKVSGIPANLIMDEPSEPIDFLPAGEATIKLVE
ncbi:MAG TPA: pilus assembly protein TadG-related protein [Oscillospiraceae bacterium]|nr:pilus assembly protein TadG-related protein [Oscillospiraceae bacterium]HPF55299.1 pilus assembly protein TadG-related protein [Clostridiales bacterium]HPK34702.1 pilus assembly protein TadG-related protein [Oscillospiraceae bacterium]HPR74534.1 pilus assembly protein TadG-related protein [Oscillospiraceae bacterium]